MKKSFVHVNLTSKQQRKKNYSVKRVMNERSNLFVLDLFSQFLNLFLASGQIEHSDLMMRLDKKSEHQQCYYISS